MRLLIIETSDSIHKFCRDISIPVLAREEIYSDSVAKDIAAGVYNCIILDGTHGNAAHQEILTDVASKPPFLPVIVIDGSLNFLRQGASESIPSKDLTAERMETALFNADRLCKLNNRSTILEMELSSLVEEDPLTALPGRSKFRVRMTKIIAKAHTTKMAVSLIILDLNSFKELNESRGHDFGDEVLKTIAKRLSKFAPSNSIVGRLGDDEFALLVVDRDLSAINRENFAVNLMHEIHKPFIIDGQKIDVNATLGLAQLDDHDTAGGLLHKSISALYAAKRDKLPFTFYTHEDDLERRQQLRLAQDLPEAIADNQLLLNYQPIVRMSDRELIGVEALVRWQHPKQGLLFPDSFIPLAEGSGSIKALTEWVLEAAVKQGSVWLAEDRNICVAVNISALILLDPTFPDMVAKLLERLNFPAEFLKLEITESAIISDVYRAKEIVTRLHELGTRLSIDDFGTGYTSLGYLRKLPVDEIKIDKSFVLNMTRVADDEVIVRTLLDLARNLGLSVVAEGVEDAETWKMLDSLGCDVAQGYFMSRPIDIEAFGDWVTSQPWMQKLN
ncbi:MAG: bifunctional diguanylate cyclase/phosphodiesterase [Sneathiella sp.]